MNPVVRRLWSGLAVAALALLGASAAGAQSVTSGAITGSVVGAGDGGALPGASISAVHQPTGSSYGSVADETGRFVIVNVRVGGPYTVSATLDGFQTTEIGGVSVNLGSSTNLAFELQPAALEESITVTAEADPIINPNKTGADSKVSTEQIENGPTVNRSLQDFARTNPYFVVDAQDFSATRLTVAGRNNRYNTIQIDGAVNNDLFGLADTGTPGGQTDTQPISLDAIAQLQLAVSPYDVRQGGFTGGGINAVTRSGGNEFTGSLYGSQRDADYVGDGPTDRPIADFDQDQYGFRLGGPVRKDSLFFFASAETNRKEEPTGVSADGSAPTQFRNPAEAQRVSDFLRTRYGLETGGLGDFTVPTDSDLAFLRLDWNASAQHQLTLRHNYVDASRLVFNGRSSTRLRFPTATYTIVDETNSTVLQLNSVFGPTSFNEARIGFQTIDDARTTPVSFPKVGIGGSPRNETYMAGTERFSGANALEQEVLEITDDFTFIRGAHTVTIGTHNEIFEFTNLFLSEATGYYFFPTVADFEAGRASEYRISFANGANPRRPAQFEVRQYGVYAGDQWRVNDRFSLTFGLRADMPDYVDTPSFNPTVRDAIGFSTSATPSDDVVLSPRIGFNWDPTGGGTQQVRGGIGVFAGRTPYVWVSNAYVNTGIETTQLSCILPACTPQPFNPDPNSQPRVGAGAALSVDLMDPDFEFPRVLRTTLGYDRQLPLGIRGTIEALWSQTQEDVFYVNVNRRPTGATSPLDGRPLFTRVSTQLADAILLTNTSKGEELTASVQLSRPFSNGLTLSAFYAYQDAESAFDATSSRAISNWQFRHTKGDIFAQDVSRSAFEIENRYSITASYAFETGALGHTVALYYNAQSGRPYSLMLGGTSSLDANGDGYGSNDLLFVPSSPDAIILRNAAGQTISYDVFAAFLRSAGVNPTAGRILDRYEHNEPWARQLDFHYGLEVPIRAVRAEVTFDILNLINMIDEDKGVVEFVGNQNYTPVNYRGIDSASGKPIYQEAATGRLTPGNQFSLADTRSRWQAKLGLRLSF